MSGAVVAIGYILLIPSVLGIISSIVLALVSTLAAGATPELTRESARTRLVAADIPARLAENVAEGIPLTTQERESLTPEQLTLVDQVSLDVATAPVGAACCGLGFVAGGIVGVVTFFVSGLLGWLLVMRKRVIRCTQCGAVFAAS